MRCKDCGRNAETDETESNGGVELQETKADIVIGVLHLFVLDGKVFTVVTDFTDEIVLNPNKKAQPVEIEEGDFMEKELIDAGYFLLNGSWLKEKDFR